MNSSSHFRRLMLLAAAAFTAVIAGAALSVALFGKTAPTSGALAGVGAAAIGGPFELQDTAGAPVTEKTLEGQVSFVYFGYTFCPDFCPIELANLADAMDALDSRGIDSRTFFITVDPERDTPEVLAEYVAHFHERTIGLWGAPEQVAVAARAYRVFYEAPGKAEDPEHYLVNHSTLVYAMAPDGAFLAFFRAATDPEEIAAQVAEALARAEPGA